jgi:hypothetical protein
MLKRHPELERFVVMRALIPGTKESRVISNGRCSLGRNFPTPISRPRSSSRPSRLSAASWSSWVERGRTGSNGSNGVERDGRTGQTESTYSNPCAIPQSAPSPCLDPSRTRRLLETPPPPLTLKVLLHLDHKRLLSKRPACVGAAA